MQIVASILGKCRRNADLRHGPHRALLHLIDEAALRLAKAHCLCEHLIEYRLQVSGRRRDDLKNLGARGLPRQRFLGLVEQPRVLDRNHGLAGEVRHQRYLPIAKRPNFLAIDDDGPDELGVLEHRHCKKCPGLH